MHLEREKGLHNFNPSRFMTTNSVITFLFFLLLLFSKLTLSKTHQENYNNAVLLHKVLLDISCAHCFTKLSTRYFDRKNNDKEKNKQD